MTPRIVHPSSRWIKKERRVKFTTVMVRSNPTRKQTFQVKARLKQNDTKTEKTRRPSKKLQAAKSKTLPARIRDLTRLLRKDNLPADVRTQTEEKLAELKQELERKRSERSQQELEKRMTLKYRKIKFFGLFCMISP